MMTTILKNSLLIVVVSSASLSVCMNKNVTFTVNDKLIRASMTDVTTMEINSLVQKAKELKHSTLVINYTDESPTMKKCREMLPEAYTKLIELAQENNGPALTSFFVGLPKKFHKALERKNDKGFSEDYIKSILNITVKSKLTGETKKAPAYKSITHITYETVEN